MNDGWARFVVFLLGDPHLLEGGQTGKDRSANPDRVFALWWSNNLDFHGGWCQSSDLLGQTVGDTAEHSSTTRKNNVCVQVFTDINITFHDGLEHSVMDTFGFFSDQCWLEKNFWAAETLVSDGDDITVWQFVALSRQGLRRQWSFLGRSLVQRRTIFL